MNTDFNRFLLVKSGIFQEVKAKQASTAAPTLISINMCIRILAQETYLACFAITMSLMTSLSRVGNIEDSVLPRCKQRPQKFETKLSLYNAVNVYVRLGPSWLLSVNVSASSYSLGFCQHSLTSRCSSCSLLSFSRLFTTLTMLLSFVREHSAQIG